MAGESIPSASRDRVSERWLGVEQALKLMQALAILLSGCWVLYTYTTFQRHANDAALTQQRLALQQAGFALSSQKAFQDAALAQAQLAAKQAQLSLDIQNSQTELRDRELTFEVESKRLANEQSRIALETQREQREQRNKELNYDVELKRLSVEQREIRGFSTNFTLTATPVANDGVVFTFDPNLVVTSDAKVQMTLILVDVYRGTLLPHSATADVPSLARQGAAAAIRICPPPGRWIARCPGGSAMHWSRAGAFGSYYPRALPTLNENFAWIASDSDIERSGPGVGPYQRGERIFYQLKFRLDVKRDDYVGVSVHFLINDAKKEEDIYWYEKHVNVAELLDANRPSPK